MVCLCHKCYLLITKFIRRLLMKTNGNDFKNWMNHGTQIQILIRGIMIIGLIALMIYGTGYAIGTFIAHLGF